MKNTLGYSNVTRHELKFYEGGVKVEIDRGLNLFPLKYLSFANFVKIRPCEHIARAPSGPFEETCANKPH